MNFSRFLDDGFSRFSVCCFVGMALVSTSWALEGGDTSKEGKWSKVKMSRPDAATRKKELADRSKAIADDIKRMKSRVGKAVTGSKKDQLHDKLKEIRKNYGWEPKSKLMYGTRAVDPLLKGQNTMPKELLAAFVQLNNDLKARGADLIIMPLVPTPLFHAHTLVDGIGPEDEYYPGWTEMMIEMMEADLEVVDTVDEFRKEAENPILVSWSNDFHTGSMGREIAAKALAERLQRYDFGRELKGNSSKWKESVKEKTGASLPQRILVVNGAMVKAEEFWQKKGLKRHEAKTKVKNGELPPEVKGLVGFKGKKGTSYARPELPKDCIPGLKGFTFKYKNLARPDNAPLKLDLVMIGDSQLHSAVYGAGLPEFIMKEVGGVFRWGSQSWKGFSPPEIYKEVAPDKSEQPRVVVLSFLPKYFWHAYDRGGKPMASKYKPKPLPPFKGAGASVASADEPKGPFEASIKVIKISKPLDPEKQPDKVDYDEALLHVAAKVQDGPMKGKEIGLRFWVMNERALINKATAVKVGDTFKLKLDSWSAVIKKDRKLGQHMVYNDTDQDLMIPVFFAIDGPLGPKSLLK